MNNAQFRKLLETPRPDGASLSGRNDPPSATPALGSKMRSSIPMTPRSLTAGNNEFARQVAAHRAAQKPAKKFRSAAPLGSKFAEGYTDRAKALREEESAAEDERVRRLEALEQLAKDGQIDREGYVRQTKLLGGDIKSTHLVKGLDFALLERVRRGENVMGESEQKEEERVTDENLEDMLDSVLEKDVALVDKKKEKKRGEMAPPAHPTRAELLEDLRKIRQAAKEAAQPSLGSKFRKIGEPSKTQERENGMKVKHIIGTDGKVKRKVKRGDKENRGKLDMPRTDAILMGMTPPPSSAKLVEEEEDDDIFAGAGEYDPLAGLGDDDEDYAEEDKDMKPQKEDSTSKDVAADPPEASTKQHPPCPPTNYFPDSPSTLTDDITTYKPPSSTSDLLVSNPSLAAALAKASKLDPVKNKEEGEREKRRRAIVEAHDRDSYDIDMGFGGSTNFADDDDEDMAAGGGGSKKRKRGKKKGGDKNSADVVGKIVEQKYGKGKGK